MLDECELYWGPFRDDFYVISLWFIIVATLSCIDLAHSIHSTHLSLKTVWKTTGQCVRGFPLTQVISLLWYVGIWGANTFPSFPATSWILPIEIHCPLNYITIKLHHLTRFPYPVKQINRSKIDVYKWTVPTCFTPFYKKNYKHW